MKRKLYPPMLLACAIVTGCAETDKDGGRNGNIPPGTNITDYVCTSYARSGSTTAVTEEGALCALTDPLNPLLNTCDVVNPDNAKDRNPDTFSEMLYTVGAADVALGGSINLTVSLPNMVQPGHVAAFDVQSPGTVLTAEVLEDIVVAASVNGVEVESAGSGEPLELILFGTPLVGGERRLVGFVNTMAYNELTIKFASTVLGAAVLSAALNVHEACTHAAPP
jgi:hypothetical protein